MTTYIVTITYTDNKVLDIEIEFPAHLIEWMIKQLVENDTQVVTATYKEK